MSELFPNLQALADGRITSGTLDQCPLLRQEARYALQELSSLRDRLELQSKEADVARALRRLVVAERDLERLQVDRLKKALASSCDEERSLSVSEGLPHVTCGLAGELEARLKAADQKVDDIVGVVARMREMLVQYRERARRVAAHPDLPQVDGAEVSGLLDEADKLIRSEIGRKL